MMINDDYISHGNGHRISTTNGGLEITYELGFSLAFAVGGTTYSLMAANPPGLPTIVRAGTGIECPMIYQLQTYGKKRTPPTMGMRFAKIEWLPEGTPQQGPPSNPS